MWKFPRAARATIGYACATELCRRSTAFIINDALILQQGRESRVFQRHLGNAKPCLGQVGPSDDFTSLAGTPQHHCIRHGNSAGENIFHPRPRDYLSPDASPAQQWPTRFFAAFAGQPDWSHTCHDRGDSSE